MAYENVGLLEAMTDILDKMNIMLAGKPLFAHINIWDNQLKNSKDGSGYSFAMPAIFLEMKQGKNTQLGKGISMMDYEIIFHIIDKQLNNKPNLERNLKVFNLRNLVKQKFQLYQPSQMGRISLIKDQQDYDHDNIYHFVCTYKGALLDNWGNTFTQQGTASIVTTLGFTGSLPYTGVGFDQICGPTFSGNPPLIVYP